MSKAYTQLLDYLRFNISDKDEFTQVISWLDIINTTPLLPSKTKFQSMLDDYYNYGSSELYDKFIDVILEEE